MAPVCNPNTDSKYLAENIVELREISEANSVRNTRLLYHWLYTCIDDHPKCQQSLGSPAYENHAGVLLPTRMIHIGSMDGSTAPRLCETKGERGYYTVLSHRWGSTPKLQLRRENFGHFTASLPLGNLPLTYKDAISVTRSLGMQYIWIDSLCIIQDDFDDWEREATQMGDIFEQASCTIAAIDAIDDTKDEDRGLFMARQQDPLAVKLECDFDKDNTEPPTPDDPCWEPTFQRLPFSYAPHKERTIVLRPRSKGLWHTIQDSKWAHRAWILQERILSRRIIYYTNRKIFWECQRMSNDEENRPNKCPPMRAQLAECFRQTASSSGHQSRDDKRFSAWWHYVEDYSSCLLTKESDKLAAFQGLCHRVGKCIEEAIFAGVILDEAGINLLWRVEANDAIAPYTQFHAPSWSWTALSSSIRYHDYSIDQPSQPLLSDLHLDKARECLKTSDGAKCRHGICGSISFHAPFVVSVAAECFKDLPSHTDQMMIQILGSSVHHESVPIPRQLQPGILDTPARQFSLPGTTQVLRAKDSNEIIGWILQDGGSPPENHGEVICAAITLRQASGRPTGLGHDQAIRGFDYMHEQNIDFIALEPSAGLMAHRRIGRGRIVAPGWIDKLTHSHFKIY